MALRLVLVGVVAGLGLTVPSRRDMEVWGHSAQRWVNARLAERESSATVDEGAYVLVAEVPARSSEAAVPAVTDGAFSAVVEALAGEFVQDAPLAAVAEGDGGGREYAAVASTREWEVLAIAPPSAPDASESDADQGFDAVMEGLASSFAADLALVIAEPPDRAFHAVVDEMAATFAADAIAVESRSAGTLTYEPLEVGEDLYPGEAYALNRAAEGIASPSPRGAHERLAKTSRLTDAVRLTREAVVAWASLLHGPAVVTIAP